MPQAIILTDGKAGHENQSRAFARALGLDAAVVPVSFKSRFCKVLSYILDHLHIRTTWLLDIELPKLAMGSIVIGTGSGTFYATKAVATRCAGRAAVVLYPRGYDIRSFDVILAPAFDNPFPEPNLITIPANLVSADEAFYEAGVEAFKARVGEIPAGPKVGVIIGGPNKCSTMTKGWAYQTLNRIFTAHQGAQMWVTTSRRTPAEVEQVVDAMAWNFKVIYSNDHFNPIPAFVKLCDVLYVSAESTGMISEACTFGTAEVRVMDNLNPGPHKFRRFVENMAADGYVGGNRKVDLSRQFAEARRLLGL